MNEEKILSDILRLERMFLVHSFLYYKLDQSILPDANYDILCKNIFSILREHPDIAVTTKYYEICFQCGDTGSGYYIQNYPSEIITAAFHVLYQQRKPSESFAAYIGRWGYTPEGR